MQNFPHTRALTPPPRRFRRNIVSDAVKKRMCPHACTTESTKAADMSIRLDTIPTLDRRTDGRKDRE